MARLTFCSSFSFLFFPSKPQNSGVLKRVKSSTRQLVPWDHGIWRLHSVLFTECSGSCFRLHYKGLSLRLSISSETSGRGTVDLACLVNNTVCCHPDSKHETFCEKGQVVRIKAHSIASMSLFLVRSFLSPLPQVWVPRYPPDTWIIARD